jgi:nucleotide-binding universal stress UspA family protein
MAYKTILVHVDRSKHLYRRIEIAAKLAAVYDAHLVGVALTGLPEIIYDPLVFNPVDPAVQPLLEVGRKRAADALVQFEALARQFNAKSIETRLEENEDARGISLQARYCDLVVLGQYDPDDTDTATPSDFAETVILESGIPALMVPFRGAVTETGHRAIISWNASKQATRAVHYALPMLKRAERVDVAVFDPGMLPVGFQAILDKDILALLARHGITATVTRKATSSDADIATALLSLAASQGSDLLVMGCYGHARFREILLGGVTTEILKSTTLPVMMAH